MPIRHTIYCKHSVAAATPEMLLKHLVPLDFWTLGEDYGISEETVRAALPLRITSLDPWRLRLSYGNAGKRPIEIDRWESEDQHRGAVQETIEDLRIVEKGRLGRVVDFLHKSIDSVSVSFGTDPPAAMFAWEVVRYFASEFDGLIETDDREWLTIGDDYQPAPV